MIPRIRYALLVLLAVPGLTCAPETDLGLRLMTFNIRYGTADDGDHAWPHRRDLVADVITRYAPDVLAIQEGLAFQLDDLDSVLEGYRKLGQHRDGGTNGEFSGLYVNERRVTVWQWGEFWLSPTPDSVASRGWDAALPRMAVWVEIDPPGGGERVRIYGTHFDHRGVTARRESATLIAQHAEGGPPAVVMGDLNAQEISDPLNVFYERGLRSAIRTADPTNELGTYNAFSDPNGSYRIDHILLDARLDVRNAEIVSDRMNGVWPSDHFPVVTVLRN